MVMDELASLFKALSDVTRLRIIKLLERGELCVCDIVAALDMQQPKVSFHLGALKDAGLIGDRKEGRWIHYRISDADLFRRHLVLSVMEKVPEHAVREDTKRLDAFRKNRTLRTGLIGLSGKTACCG
jgi:ArsR family transcriptional regulator